MIHSVGEGTHLGFLVGGQSSSPIEHCCLDLIDNQTKVRPDLQETPFETVINSLWMVLPP
jgi:hypothetical protein